MSQSEIDRLYRTYGFIIYGRCIRLLGSRDEARDAMQVVFMKLLQAYDTIQEKEKVVPWIFRTAQNHCFNLLRDRKKFVREIQPDDCVDSRSDGDRIAKRDLIERIMKRFNNDIRDAVYYTYVEEFDQREIQKLTGQSPATIRRNLKRFRDALPVALKRLGLDGV
ncbi:MAG: sigma-70 family RNA polymerase sigma factor [Chitinispirillaceae bacterium]|nr:sigma-70 family RNA polymerase sigma factor [Chitinispirillaceae bacterium]